MQLNPNVTYSDISEVTGFSESKTYRVIQALRAKDIVVRVGARKNGTWKVVVAIGAACCGGHDGGSLPPSILCHMVGEMPLEFVRLTHKDRVVGQEQVGAIVVALIDTEQLIHRLARGDEDSQVTPSGHSEADCRLRVPCLFQPI